MFGYILEAEFCLVIVTLCVHFVAARDAETRRARQEQRGNAAATAAAALQARHVETTQTAGRLISERVYMVTHTAEYGSNG